MSKKALEIIKIKDLALLRSAPILNEKQSKILFTEAKQIISATDWLTIGVMALSINEGINSIRDIEEEFNLNKMNFVDLPSANGPVFIKANQKTGEIHARIEYGLGEGILISCHNNDSHIDTETIGPFPLDFFHKK